ncbi:MAG: flagellar basal body P-ring protein FlgI [Proteobacteria bacterium]|nr:flagellar basal body P-ring protein FlgI [Pseudomonadota bacterium]
MQQTSNIIGNNNTVIVDASQNNQNSSHNNNNSKNTPPPGQTSESMISLLKLQSSRLEVLQKKFETEKKEIIESTVSEVEKNAQIKTLEAKQKLELESFNNENKEQINKLNAVELEKYNANRRKNSDDDSNNLNPDFSTTATINEEKGKFTILDAGTNLEDVVNGLNSLGVTPKEMGSILRAIKAAGALQADIKDT